jgi:hypothetical protein
VVTGGGFASIHFYPNPFTDMMDIVNPSPFSKLSLRNLQGQILWLKGYGDGVSSVQVPVAGLPAGRYFVQVDGPPIKAPPIKLLESNCGSPETGTYHGLWDQASDPAS